MSNEINNQLTLEDHPTPKVCSRSSLLTNPSPLDAKPFLKWVGGKRSIIKELKDRMPRTYNNYFEPFIGGGALFFNLHPKNASISDTNPDLITTYLVIRDNIDKLLDALDAHQKAHCKEYYYKVRSMHHLKDPIEIAARMIYLNKTCFNGLWRVNKKGEFNTPIGAYSNPSIFQEDNLRACSIALKNTTIELRDYLKIQPTKGDFCYFDPPYHPINDSSFTAYSKQNFSKKDQAELAEFCKQLHEKGVNIMISNSNTLFIRELYKSDIFKIATIDAPRLVNCKANARSIVEEVIITNY